MGLGMEIMELNTTLEAGPSRRRCNDIEAQILHEIDIMDQELAGAGIRNTRLFDNTLFHYKTVIRFNSFSAFDNSLKRVLVVAPEQPQCRF